jgi:hypothetical protein
MTRGRLYTALGALGTLGLGAALVLRGDARTIVLIFLAGLAVKSWIAYKKETLE